LLDVRHPCLVLPHSTAQEIRGFSPAIIRARIDVAEGE
jgi:hypothetical protein